MSQAWLRKHKPISLIIRSTIRMLKRHQLQFMSHNLNRKFSKVFFYTRQFKTPTITAFRSRNLNNNQQLRLSPLSKSNSIKMIIKALVSSRMRRLSSRASQISANSLANKILGHRSNNMNQEIGRSLNSSSILNSLPGFCQLLNRQGLLNQSPAPMSILRTQSR